MHLGAARRLLVTLVVMVAALGCAPSSGPPPIDHVALETEIERAITTGPATLDNVRAVLVSVDGETKIEYYRNGFTEEHHGHVWSVTKSVVSILIGIAVADGLIADIDQPLAELLPGHRRAMSDETARVTLRQLMTMSGGFDDYMFVRDQWEQAGTSGKDYVDLLLARPQYPPGRIFWYSNPSSHLAAAVLAAALERADGDRPRTILDYGREKLFDPLGISTRPASTRPVPDLFALESGAVGFGWGTDPDGIHLGAAGLRLTAPDMLKIGELYRRGGTWNGQQIVPTDWIRESTAPSTTNPHYGLFWWILDEADGPGYLAAGAGEQRITVLPDSRAVIVYLCDLRPGRELTRDDVRPLDDVLAAAFR